MQRAAESDIHLLKAAADAEQRHAASDADLDQRQRQRIAPLVIGFVVGMRLGAEAAGMNIGAAARQQHAVDHIEQRADIGDIRRAGEHQRQRAGDLGNGAKVSFADTLRGEPVFEQVRIADHADHRPLHRRLLTSRPQIREMPHPGDQAPPRGSAAAWQN